jgi:hypothetical protein
VRFVKCFRELFGKHEAFYDSRYAHGPKTVSASQLPAESEGTREFKALRTISRSKNELDSSEFELEKHSIDKETDHVDPVKWFGILVPQSLKTARDSYEKATELVIESANVEQRLRKNYELLDKLKTIKVNFENTEE